MELLILFVGGRAAASKFACAEGVRLPEGEARVPKGAQAAEPPGWLVHGWRGFGQPFAFR